jgi:hypothetical protein
MSSSAAGLIVGILVLYAVLQGRALPFYASIVIGLSLAAGFIAGVIQDVPDVVSSHDSCTKDTNLTCDYTSFDWIVTIGVISAIFWVNHHTITLRAVDASCCVD